MQNDKDILTDTLAIIIDEYGVKHADRFVSLVKDEAFDFRKWYDSLDGSLTEEERCANGEFDWD